MPIPKTIIQNVLFFLRTIADNTGAAAFDDTDLIAATQDVELSVDENKAKVILNTAAVDTNKSAVDLVKTAVDENKAKVILNTTAVDSVKTAVDENKAEVILNTAALDLLDKALDVEIVGSGITRVIVVAGATGTLGIDIETWQAGIVEYDEAFSVDVEGTIDNWITSHAANILANQGITTAKISSTEILLIGATLAGNWTFIDGSVTMTATINLTTVTENDVATVAAIASLKIQVDLITTAVDQLISQSFGGAGFEIAGGVTTETLTVAVGGGTLGIDITSGSGPTIAYDETYDSSIENTIDLWLASHAAAVLTAHGITATKDSASTILLTGSVPAGIWVFADGGATTTVTSGGQSTAMNTVTTDCSVIEVVADAIFDVATTVGFGDVLPFGHAATAGTKIVGNFTNIKLVSGVALCYVI